MKTNKSLLLVVLVLGLLIYGGVQFFSKSPVSEKGQVVTLPSRAMMEYAMNLVREKKPSPPRSARLYAYTATVYHEVLLVTKNQNEALLATGQIINEIFPDKVASTSVILSGLGISGESELSSTANSVLEKYSARQKTDIDLTKIPKRPVGEQYWVGENPLEPTAGSWVRWNVPVDSTFTVPPPPVFGSDIYREGLEEVKRAAEERTTEQGAKVNFWGGVPGTEAPAGIWQNRLNTVIKNKKLSDKEYSYVQMILAQTLADAFLECWKVKYQYEYWTKRPSMVDGSINLAMQNPPFPSYVSGHSTISRAAAEVLAVLLPEYRDTWLYDAEEAKNTRLWGGIHFAYDNEVGADLGRQIATRVIELLTLKSIDAK